MAQKYYVASKGNPYLTLSEEPGVVTKQLIRDNIERMMEMDEEEGEERTPKERFLAANAFYEEHLDRITEMAPKGYELEEITEDQAEELMSLSLEGWTAWELPVAEWD